MSTYDEGLARENAEELEALVDRVGIYDLISLLEDICYAKAEHLRSNWQDEETGQAWQDVGEAIGETREKAGRLP